MLPLVLLPLLFGVLYYGNVIWSMQSAQGTAARLPLAGITGNFTCDGLVARVKSTVLAALPGLDDNLTGLGLDDIGVTVLQPIPEVGAVLSVSVEVPIVDSIGNLLPLPSVTNVVSEASYRLDNVRVTTDVCT